eukprot:TRINITY_DN5931_c5_g1_i1.p1 TRINITY_DN5931_c5_g1~~TRINITY_DN5931_c5_g1_i1.p1  ORF type:complete len:652 (+),score=233.02 TRINITY_DN5931_c5_g1_i1:71-2026(+)
MDGDGEAFAQVKSITGLDNDDIVRWLLKIGEGKSDAAISAWLDCDSNEEQLLRLYGRPGPAAAVAPAAAGMAFGGFHMPHMPHMHHHRHHHMHHMTGMPPWGGPGGGDGEEEEEEESEEDSGDAPEDIVDGMVAAWSCENKGTRQAYKPADSRKVERLFRRWQETRQKPSEQITLSFSPEHRYTFDFSRMLQKNVITRKERRIQRDMRPARPAAAAAAADSQPEMGEDHLQRVLRVVAAIDERVAKLEKLEGTKEYTAEGLVKRDEAELIGPVFDRICELFKQKKFKHKYGYSSADRHCLQLRFGEHVPPYYANVHGQSIWQRKMLSIAGLRNLVRYGPEIFEELRQKFFSGKYDDYKHPGSSAGTGLHKMKHYTGNVVDLDTVVLRCSDNTVREAINKNNKHPGSCTGYRCQYKSAEDFAESEQAREIAITAAGEAIIHFVHRFKINTRSELRKRHLDFDHLNTKQQVPVAGGSRERGMWPLWHYVNVGVNSFHVNVPNMPDVYGALLRAPFHAARAMCTILTHFKGAEQETWIENFFEDCIADSCFNAKWKAIEEFNMQLAHLGTIEDVLQKIEQREQEEFGALYDAGGEREQEKVAACYAKHARCGRPDAIVARAADGTLRPITEEDVGKHVAKIYADEAAAMSGVAH